LFSVQASVYFDLGQIISPEKSDVLIQDVVDNMTPYHYWRCSTRLFPEKNSEIAFFPLDMRACPPDFLAQVWADFFSARCGKEWGREGE